jgi:Peptidase family M23
MSRLIWLVVAIAAALTFSAAAVRSGPSGGYGWPVKPFDRAHRVRSNFGDPRTLFRGPPTPATLYSGAGSFSLHDGIDIAAPDGTPVYPVRSGVVTTTSARKVFVRADDGDRFEYWHIVPTVAVGSRVSALETVLGRIRTSYGHVHLAQIHNGRPVNPLAPGHLTPYEDVTNPQIDYVALRRAGTTTELLPELVRGTIEIDVAAFDTPRPAAPGEWAAMPTTPALITWRVEQASHHQVRIPERIALDTRIHLPENRPFWSIYARGTRQNMPTFLKHRYWRDTGLFLFRLGILDTRKLQDGIYTVVVTAADIAGNTTTRRITFLVYNRDRWPPETKQA